VSRIAAVILAAGTSSRLGRPKQLLDLGRRPILRHTVDAVRRSSLDPIFVVLGHERERIAASVDLSEVVEVNNPDFASGQSSSVRAAIRELPDDVDAAVFLLGDQPLVAPEVIDILAAARREQSASIAQPRYAEGRGNPVLFGREHFAELSQLTGDVGARPLLERYRDQLVLVDASGHHRPDDIDTVEDYERVKCAFDCGQGAS
jgi:molybdenum cofactor cytidylyltransferase